MQCSLITLEQSENK